MGTSIQRNDIPAKVNGTAQYGLDVKLPNMKYATIKASPVFGNKVLRVDESALTKRADYQKVINLENAVVMVSDGYWKAKKGLGELIIEFETSENDKLKTEAIFADFDKLFIFSYSLQYCE